MAPFKTESKTQFYISIGVVLQRITGSAGAFVQKVAFTSHT